MTALKLISFAVLFSFCDSVLHFPDYLDHPCRRPCNGTKRTCYYEFKLERMFSMEVDNCKGCLTSSLNDCLNPDCVVVDGTSKLIYTINRRFPGPQIEVCKGDEINVLVKNHLLDASTSIHWHGIHQRATPFMDGVPSVTQCPIPPLTKFLYQFEATQQGTHFYHSHSGFQRTDGLSGSLIVKIPDEDNKLLQYYDYDLSGHVIQITDWLTRDGVTEYYNVVRNKVYQGTNSAILINGYGSNLTNNVPIPIFSVEKGFRYRFRVIHTGSSSCPVSISIDNHKISIVSFDGNDLNPQEVEILTLTPGDRVDFILSANQTEDFYWIKATGASQCARLQSVALLRYEAENVTVVPSKYTADFNRTRNSEMNVITVTSKKRITYTYDNLTTIEKFEPFLQKANFKYMVGVSMRPWSSPIYEDGSGKTFLYPLFNNISLVMPPSNLLEGSPQYKYCNRENMESCDQRRRFCECLHVVEIPYNSVVELILVTETLGPITHPIHLHGYAFRILAHENLGRNLTVQEIEKMDREGLLKRNLNNPPIKDTITMPNGGYSIIRFKADNEGYWLMHCHMEYHMELGMAMVFKVGEPNAPPPDFPKCGDYYGSIGCK